jgi:cysteine synthase
MFCIGVRNMGNSEEMLLRALQRCREKRVVIPTFEQMACPEEIPSSIKKDLTTVGLWDVHPANLFRICWKNTPVPFGGGFGTVNVLEIPRELTGVKARILMLLGKYFPIGTHKVGATFGPLVEKLVQGGFDPTRQKALWPSTGNYCRGGAYDAALLACHSIAVLPEGMSKERFDWLEGMGAEIHATPGSESNVKEVFDKAEQLKRERPEEVVMLNQFSDFGNSVWHYKCTGQAIEEVMQGEISAGYNFKALFLTQGSAGTMACGDYIREKFPRTLICAGEALQCPTLLYNGYGVHRIEGIGDKHVPWIFNVRNLDAAAGVDDEDCLRTMSLFNEKEGQSTLRALGVPDDAVCRLPDLGISGIANLLGSIKTAKYYEMGDKDVLVTIATDSMELYRSRLEEQRKLHGPYTQLQARIDLECSVRGQASDHFAELGYWDKKRIHNLKYFTWVEQRGMDETELTRQWEDESYWSEKLNLFKKWDRLIKDFNQKTGLLTNRKGP